MRVTVALSDCFLASIQGCRDVGRQVVDIRLECRQIDRWVGVVGRNREDPRQNSVGTLQNSACRRFGQTHFGFDRFCFCVCHSTHFQLRVNGLPEREKTGVPIPTTREGLPDLLPKGLLLSKTPEFRKSEMGFAFVSRKVPILCTTGKLEMWTCLLQSFANDCLLVEMKVRKSGKKASSHKRKFMTNSNKNDFIEISHAVWDKR
jgi:hypothetical protein